MSKISKMLMDLRLRNELNQKEVSNYLGVSQAQISRYESGSNEPSIDHLTKLAKLFKVKPDVFFETDIGYKNHAIAAPIVNEPSEGYMADFAETIKYYKAVTKSMAERLTTLNDILTKREDLERALINLRRNLEKENQMKGDLLEKFGI